MTCIRETILLFFFLMDGVWAEEGAGKNTKLHLSATAVSP